MRAIQRHAKDFSPRRLLEQFFAASDTLVFGKEKELKVALTCLLSRGHLLIEDVPGMGKTTFVMVLGHLLSLKVGRIQFTNDMLPGDILGTNVFDPALKKFEFHRGPIFSQLVLGDELNRATPKTQSGFLQAMEERAVTVDGVTYPLPEPFFLIATQNPTDQAGTYPLPESQLDRFSMRIHIGPPSRNSEIEILRKGDSRARITDEKPVISVPELLAMQKEVQGVHASDALLGYVQDLLAKSREASMGGGLSPRAGLLLLSAARAWAYLEGRPMVLPEDIKAVAKPVLSHRLHSGRDRRAGGGEEIVNQILESVAVP
jgi:MoxR-like ATPase